LGLRGLISDGCIGICSSISCFGVACLMIAGASLMIIGASLMITGSSAFIGGIDYASL